MVQPPSQDEPSSGDDVLSGLIAAITAEFDVALGSAERVQDAYRRLGEALESLPDEAAIRRVQDLLPLLHRRTGAVAAALFAFFEELAARLASPWLVLSGLLQARDGALKARAMDLLASRVEDETVRVDAQVLEAVAQLIESDERLAAAAETLDQVEIILRHWAAAPGTGCPVVALYLAGGAPTLRRLAARVLDRAGQPADLDLARRLLGDEAHAFLAPYLAFTRATHTELLALVPAVGDDGLLLPSLRAAQAQCGEELLREAISRLGWLRLNLGIEVRHYIGLSVAGSFPLLLSPGEALLFESQPDSRRVFDRWLFVAHGGDIGGDLAAPTDGDPIGRFRAYNLTHAEALADILDVSPLTPEKVRRIIARMDRITADYGVLFARYSDECAALPEHYERLRARILADSAGAPEGQPLSAEITRLVQMFEDPATLADVRTLHGLKRYLHQKGLRLGFRLVESGRTTNRTVDLVLATPQRVQRVVRSIQYVDFEPDDSAGCRRDSPHEAPSAIPHPASPPLLPYAVAVVADGFARQLLHDLDRFPSMRIFCYGNEVHYFAAFGNHPAFIRIDYSPPLRGGMIDVEYFGVSKYSLDQHPAPHLDGIRSFFLALEYDCQVESTRIHARYDKERALDLNDLCTKAEALFRLVPYLMEVDWVIGSLELNELARRAIAPAWADFFSRWGVLPIRQLLTEDRRGILAAVANDAAGEREIAWSGAGPYHDRFSIPPPKGFLGLVNGALQGRGLPARPDRPTGPEADLAQLPVERGLLEPLRQAIRRGETRESESGALACSMDLFESIHEAERFAALLSGPTAPLAHAAALAGLIVPLERGLRFRTTGSVNGCEVQQARLGLRGEALWLYVMRDDGGIAALAFFTRDGPLHRRREEAAQPWRDNASFDPVELGALLRRNNYLTDATAPPGALSIEDAERLRERFRLHVPVRGSRPLPDDRVVTGLRASPGRAVGLALFDTKGRRPADFEGAVLVAPIVQPADDAYLYRAAAIVSTGGGILSHAGLLANQFRKPAIIIDGEWTRTSDGGRALSYSPVQYEEVERDIDGYRVALRSDFRRREERLREGDLLVVDADEGTLRVLGQNHEALALHDHLRHLRESWRRIDQGAEAQDLLVLRGRRLHARHHIERLLGELRDPVLARHAAHELLIEDAEMPGCLEERARLLSILLQNSAVGLVVRSYVGDLWFRLADRLQAAWGEARRLIPSACRPYEVLTLRRDVLRLHAAAGGVRRALAAGGAEVPSTVNSADFDRPAGEPLDEIDRWACRRLEELRAELIAGTPTASAQSSRELRRLLRQFDQIDLVIQPAPAETQALRPLRERLAREDRSALEHCAHRRVLDPDDCGLDLEPFIGSKAANLGEVRRIIGADMTPPWFVVTEHAFREALNLPVLHHPEGTRAVGTIAPTLSHCIESALLTKDSSELERSFWVRTLWESIALPRDLAKEVRTAYYRLSTEDSTTDDGLAELPPSDSARSFVAIRSSSWEEDTEAATRAGEFDTFLFIRGEQAVLEHLKRAWSGLWTDRAIHNRAALGFEAMQTGGGVLVQRMIRARVSGVLQTINAAEGRQDEMVINAGLGLGEGVVSGTVAADQIVVAKDSVGAEAPLRLRYHTADKREQVVFDEQRGYGTVHRETRYHQRLRPALEYIEIRELVQAAAKLETAYGYPLDIEFGIEGARLYILQVRPLPVLAAVLRETLDRYPLKPGRSEPRP